jgi:ligand-binding SRPBCC domain-containing protein
MEDEMHFCFEQSVGLEREGIFAFFENPGRIALLHEGWSKVRLLKHEAKVRVGAELWVEVTLAGFIPMVLGFRHYLFEPPVRFGEKAIHGPFSRFVHIHEFVIKEGETVVRDLLEVRLPWHYGGAMSTKHIVGPGLTRCSMAAHKL